MLRAGHASDWLRPPWLRALLGLAYCGLAMNYLASDNAARLLDYGGALRALVGVLNSLGVLVLFAAYCSVALRGRAAAREQVPAAVGTLGGPA
jgi:hypothetical protein